MYASTVGSTGFMTDSAVRHRAFLASPQRRRERCWGANTHLDLRHQVELGQLLVSLARKHGLAVLMASHDLNLAGAFADRLLLLNEGKLVANGTPDEMLRPEILQPVYGLKLIRVETGAGRTPLLAPVVTSE